MELHVVDTEGIPEGCVLSVRAGSTRRQAPASADRPFRFPASSGEALPFKVDVLEPVASARLILRPGEEKRKNVMYTIPLDCLNQDNAEKCPAGPSSSVPMSVTFAVQPIEEQKEETKSDEQDGAYRKRGSSHGSSSSSRHYQAKAAREYLDQHNLVEFTQLLVQSVIKEQPDRPYDFMSKQFYFPEPLPRDR